MKKLALVAVLAGISTLASANSGLYIQGDVGYSKLQYARGTTLRDNGVKATVAVGKDTGDMRYQVDFTQYNDAKNGGTDIEAVQSVGVSAIYDFETTNPLITPYAGTRLAVNHIETRVGDKKKQKDQLGLGATAGVQFHINDQVAIDTGVEYHKLGSVDGIRGEQFGAKVGARMNF